MKVCSFTSVVEANQLLEDTPLHNKEDDLLSAGLSSQRQFSPEREASPEKTAAGQQRVFKLLKDQKIKSALRTLRPLTQAPQSLKTGKKCKVVAVRPIRQDQLLLDRLVNRQDVRVHLGLDFDDA